MDIQKEREALIAEIEVFKAEMLKSYVIKAWADSYVNTDPFSYAIFEDENNKIWWMKAQTHEFWRIWQAAKAQSEKALLEQFEINNKLVEQIEKLKADVPGQITVTHERLQELIAIGVKAALEEQK